MTILASLVQSAFAAVAHLTSLGSGTLILLATVIGAYVIARKA